MAADDHGMQKSLFSRIASWPESVSGFHLVRRSTCARDARFLASRGGGALLVAVTLCTIGCQTTGSQTAEDLVDARHERHLQLFGNFDLPRSIGTVENIGLQLPVISPDGQHVLYLRSDRDYFSPMTLLGSGDPRHTPPEGNLTIWIRSLSGNNPGRPFSRERWAHSPVWSASGRSVAYVENEPPFSFVAHVDLDTGQKSRFGLPDAVNCLPRFANDDQTLVFCSGSTAAGPFRVCRQRLGDREPQILTPEGMDCLFPLCVNEQGQVLCARLDGDRLCWVQAGPDSTSDLATSGGFTHRPDLLQTWAGIGSPLAPDGRAFLFYDARLNRISACNLKTGRIVRHRQASIAACWLNSEAIALATAEGVFLVDTITGFSPGLFNGTWIPCRFDHVAQRLLLLGKDGPRRFSIIEIQFKPGELSRTAVRPVLREMEIHASQS